MITQREMTTCELCLGGKRRRERFSAGAGDQAGLYEETTVATEQQGARLRLHSGSADSSSSPSRFGAYLAWAFLAKSTMRSVLQSQHGTACMCVCVCVCVCAHTHMGRQYVQRCVGFEPPTITRPDPVIPGKGLMPFL